MKLRKASIFVKIVILALAGYAIVSMMSLKVKLAEAESYREDLEKAVAQMEQENAGLRYEIAHSEDDDTIADIAREKLGLVMPGEKIFYDIGN